jgi:hypothetical protein
MSNSLLTKWRLAISLFFALTGCIQVLAQMPNDAIYMGKNTACLAVSYNRSAWDKYWENSMLRENLNIGTLTTQSVMPMLAVGVTKNINVIAGLPYVWTQASAGNLKWQNGVQDASAWLKYRFLNKSGLSLHAIVGGSIPASNYIPDFLPMSIGLQAKTATGRFLASYRHQTGIYLTSSAAYTLRSRIRIDRDAYQADGRVYNTNQVSVPNSYDFSARLGYLKKAVQGEAFIEHSACDGGDYIRRNDMPFPTNNMKGTNVGIYAKFQPKNIGVNARASHTISGRNAGQSTAFSVGILYQFRYLKPSAEKQ